MFKYILNIHNNLKEKRKKLLDCYVDPSSPQSCDFVHVSFIAAKDSLGRFMIIRAFPRRRFAQWLMSSKGLYLYGPSLVRASLYCVYILVQRALVERILRRMLPRRGDSYFGNSGNESRWNIITHTHVYVYTLVVVVVAVIILCRCVDENSGNR